MKKLLLAPALAGLAAATCLTGTAQAQTQKSARPESQCFHLRDWHGWKATPDAKAIYIRVGRSDIRRLDLMGSCPALNAGGTHLVTRVRGSSWICHPLDLDLGVADRIGPRSRSRIPCPVTQITRLTPAEAAALPKGLRP
jgi:hypothetical protein